ncbi:capsular biosynthesis protein [Bacillus sp. EB106-08-02-XG196]|uniref:YveK family protein n=1 Tax=Bacillus sp. EB106-08-02-XG196 TaxID=2737049 RepID=UPI0015C442AA|nr:Wzz/FepE/Etk N-terminal domain-containing protein [Bacillus sp. EB106-08-02-XG196]NWQ39182.1 capsular biosynthesis protein [Bacillus sp. EB106-08-02-XG196]
MNNFNQISENKRKAKEINLLELFTVLKRRFWLIVVITIIATIAGIIINNSASFPLYQSSSRIIIGADEESRKTLQVIVRDSSILDLVIEELNLSKSAEELAGQISVQSVDGSQVVSISVVDTDPVQAAVIADTTAKVFQSEVPKIVGEDYIRSLSKAKINPAPINPKTNNKIIIAIIGGIVAGVGLAFLLETLDDRIRSEKEIERMLGVQVLGKVSKMNKRNIRKRKKVQSDLEQRGEPVGY